MPTLTALDRVGDEVGGDDQAGDRQRREQRRPPLPGLDEAGTSSLIVRPQSGDGGWMPAPRNDSVAIVNTA